VSVFTSEMFQKINLKIIF